MEFVFTYSSDSLCLTLLELLSCPELHSILRLVLKAGNYMNAVSYSLFILLSFSSYFQSSSHLFNPPHTHLQHLARVCLGTSLYMHLGYFSE